MGRKPKHTPEQLKVIQEGVNTLYHLSSCGVSKIAAHFGISIQKVNQLLLPKDKFLKGE
jgi:hypothetical protein